MSEAYPRPEMARSKSERREAPRKLPRYDMDDPLDDANGVYNHNYKRSLQAPVEDMRGSRYGY